MSRDSVTAGIFLQVHCGRFGNRNDRYRIVMLKSARLLMLTLGVLSIGSLLLALLVGSSAAGPATLLNWWSGTATP